VRETRVARLPHVGRVKVRVGERERVARGVEALPLLEDLRAQERVRAVQRLDARLEQRALDFGARAQV
jgi:hypothetical protein